MRYPNYRSELLSMLEEDQREVRSYSRMYRRARKATDTQDMRDRLVLRSAKRAKRMLEILSRIGAPSIENVGADGSQAISVLALHARLSVMKEVLVLYEESWARDRGSVYFEA